MSIPAPKCPPGLVYDYTHGMSLKACGRKHGLHRSEVNSHLKRAKVMRRLRSMPRPFRAITGLMEWSINQSDIIDPEFDELVEPITIETMSQLGYCAADCNSSGIYRGDEWRLDRHGAPEAGFHREPLASPVSPLAGIHSGASTSPKLRTPVLAEQADLALKAKPVTLQERLVVREANKQNTLVRKRKTKLKRLKEKRRRLAREIAELHAEGV